MEHALACYDLAIKKVELELLAVLNDAHPEFLGLDRGLKRSREDSKARAWSSLEARTVALEACHQHGLSIIEGDYDVSLSLIKDRMGQEVSKKVTALEMQRDGGKTSAPTRSLRSKARRGDGDDEEDGEDTLASVLASAAASLPGLGLNPANAGGRNRAARRGVSPVSLVLDKQAEEEDLLGDLQAIARDAHQCGATTEIDLAIDLAPATDASKASASNRKRRASSTPTPKIASPGSPTGLATVARQVGRTTPVQATRGGRSSLSPHPGAGLKSVVSNIRERTVEVDGEKFAKGMRVTAREVGGAGDGAKGAKTTANSTVTGTVSSVNNSEVHLKLDDGTKHRIYLSHLKNGRIVLGPS